MASDAEKFSWDADQFAEDAAGPKMRRNSRVRGGKIQKRIVTVVFEAEKLACDAEPAQTAPKNRKPRRTSRV